MLGIERLLFTSGASESMRCWKLEVGLAQDENTPDGEFNLGRLQYNVMMESVFNFLN